MRLSVSTPRGAVVEAEVEEITAPGVLGELGILPQHIPLLTALRPGVLTYRTKEHTAVLAVANGFLQVASHGAVDRVLVLVDDARRAAEVDRAEAEREAAETDAALSQWKDESAGAYQSLRTRREWAQARLDAAARSAAP